MLRWLRLAVLVLVPCTALAQDAVPYKVDPQPLNSAKAMRAHYVVIVSFDGFRWDYAKKFNATHLLALAAEGASTPEGMIPSYPTLTYPNHYTLVTGLYPEHHGIVSNKFLDPARNYAAYVYNNATQNDGTWYGGDPLWVLAGEQGMRSATMFWVASEATIRGRKPTYYMPFNDQYDDEKRVTQVMDWLSLPPKERPHFITVYFSNVDHAAHQHTPESPEVKAAVEQADALIGELQEKLRASKLPVDLILVSDHGGIAYKSRNWIELNKIGDLSGVIPGPETRMYPKDEAGAMKAYESLKALNDDRFDVYRQKDVPSRLHYNDNARIGDPVIIWTQPYALRTMVDLARTNDIEIHRDPGDHGFDVKTITEMKAIFYAWGKDIKPGTQLPSFENVNVYDFVCGLLGLKPAKNDGSPNVLKAARK